MVRVLYECKCQNIEYIFCATCMSTIWQRNCKKKKITQDIISQSSDLQNSKRRNNIKYCQGYDCTLQKGV